MTAPTHETRSDPIPTLALKVVGDPLDPNDRAVFIKPTELVDAVEITPLNRSELILYNQLIANAWNAIEPGKVFTVAKSRLRGSHESNDRLHDSFDRLMSAFAKVKVRDPKSGLIKTVRINLLGPNAEEEGEEGLFHYTLHPSLMEVLKSSRSWARLRSEMQYLLRSKYSIRLYEMIEQRINLRKQADTFAIPDLKGLLGVPKGKLSRFADFNAQCLKVAVGEVNQLTDFEVAIGLKKRGRIVETITLTWMKKCPEARIEAANERQRSRIGRIARRKATVEVIV
ncbi:MAG: replication initiation protein [Alphaproteobacteria bacterium]|nr:replication initiation protein [Alphaproteobacteria bacterium]